MSIHLFGIPVYKTLLKEHSLVQEDFKEILKEQFKDLVTEETLTAVHEAFEQAVTEKATQKAG